MKTFKQVRRQIEEGNPLSRMTQFDKEGRHSVAMSAERKHLSPEENAARMKQLRDVLRERGYGFRRTRGKWDEGDGVGSENSIVVHAQEPGKKGAANLLRDTKKLDNHFDQDAILHRSPGGKGTAIYTKDTKDNKRGEKTTLGDTKFNTPNPYGETEYKTRKPENVRPRFTFKE